MKFSWAKQQGNYFVAIFVRSAFFFSKMSEDQMFFLSRAACILRNWKMTFFYSLFSLLYSHVPKPYWDRCRELETLNETANMTTYASIIKMFFKIVTVVVLFWNFMPNSAFCKTLQLPNKHMTWQTELV